MKQYFVGIDIGSTASKVVVLEENKVADAFVLPTGWNGRETARQIFDILNTKGFAENMRCVATGYGRISVDYADKVITEITCHGKGGFALFGQDGTIVDIGGQDTKVIHIRDGTVADFLMNDKCAAGTGKFIEVMANRLGTDLAEFYALAQTGTPVSISAMCTVFAESEVIGHIGAGRPRADIAAGVIDSVASRVSNLVTRFGIQGPLHLTGGLCDSPYFLEILSQKTNRTVTTHPMAGMPALLVRLWRLESRKPSIGAPMIKKTEKLVITFYTTTAAMAMEKLCKESGADGRLIPVPGSISADCGLAWCAKNESEDALLELMVASGITPQGIYHCLV